MRKPAQCSHLAPTSKYASGVEANGTSYALAFRSATWGLAAAAGRMTGISPRVLQFYGEPQSEKENPFARGARILRALRELGAPNWSAPISALCSEFGGDFVPRPDTDAKPGALLAAGGALAKETGEGVQALLRFAESASPDDARRALPEIEDVIRAAYLARRIAEDAARAVEVSR